MPPKRSAQVQIFGLHAAALEGPGENVRANRGDGDRPTAHRARIVDQQRHHRVLEFGVALDLVAQRMAGADDDPRQPRGVEQPLLLVELPAARLLRQQPPLEPVGEPGDDVLEPAHLLVEIGAQAAELFLVAQFAGLDDLVEAGRVDLVVGLRREIPVAPAGRREACCR